MMGYRQSLRIEYNLQTSSLLGSHSHEGRNLKQTKWMLFEDTVDAGMMFS